ncbi:histidinol-phosphate transaminase [Pantanalinema rosaneae CENA516]|uniref:histidinol-phosphate transaminase n=1 Tax=Pantanalinema rosaneae TaxID=1620701 RepID=UPI003D6EF051
MFPFIRADLAQLTAYTPHTADESEPSDSHLRSDTLKSIGDRLDTNESPYDLPEELKQKLAWTYQQTLENNRYPDGGHAGLKQAIATYVNESAALPSTPFTADHITVGNGSDELIRSILIATCLGGEGAILVAEPTFSMYGILAQTLGIPVVSVDRSITHFEVNLQAAQQAISQTTNPAIRAVFMVHPNSPTGNAMTQAEIDWLRRLPDEILVVIDEAYFEFSQTTIVSALLDRPNWIVLRTFSKAFRLAAHRVGYAIAHPAVIATLEKVRLPYNLPSFSQAAAYTVLSHRQQLLQTIPLLLEQRTHLTQALLQHPQLQVWQSAANFIYVRLRHHEPEQAETVLHQMHIALKQQGTLIRHTSGGLRITVGSPAENARTIAHLQAVLSTGVATLATS